MIDHIRALKLDQWQAAVRIVGWSEKGLENPFFF